MIYLSPRLQYHLCITYVADCMTCRFRFQDSRGVGEDQEEEYQAYPSHRMTLDAGIVSLCIVDYVETLKRLSDETIKNNI
jgi:hypothetical protein